MLKTLALVGIACAVACTPKAQATKDDAGAAVAVAPKEAPPPPPKKSVEDQVEESVTFAAAFALAKPEMEDSTGKLDHGTVMLARWSAKGLRWSDVVVAQNETTFASVQKDSEEARGKHMCVSGSIIQIEVVKTDVGKLFDGLLSDYSHNLYKFTVAGSTGDLVEGSAARLCGVVTGKHQYSNSGGGTGHTIKLVGMFDLPANTKAKP